jgi:hypothetical protein
MSTTYVDRGGFEWDRSCGTCHQRTPSYMNKWNKDHDHCRGYDQDDRQEPFKTYQRNHIHSCPFYLRTDRD